MLSLFLKEFANIRILSQIFNRDLKNYFLAFGRAQSGWREAFFLFEPGFVGLTDERMMYNGKNLTILKSYES